MTPGSGSTSRNPISPSRNLRYGGIRLNAVGTLDLDIEEVRSILAESKMMNAEILIRGNATQDDLIDAVQGNRVYIPAFIAVNKVDLVDKETISRDRARHSGRFGSHADHDLGAAGYHTEELKDAIYDSLGFMRVYLKPVGEEADLEEPLIVRRESTVEDVCNQAPPGVRAPVQVCPCLGKIREAWRPAGGRRTGFSMGTSSPSSLNTRSRSRPAGGSPFNWMTYRWDFPCPVLFSPLWKCRLPRRYREGA